MEFSDLARLASGHVEARIVQTALQLGIFDILGNNSLDARAIALSLGSDPRATELLLNTLVALGLLEKQSDRFFLTAVSSKYLVKTSGQYYGDMILFDAALWSCWEALAAAIRTGQPTRPPNMYQDDPRETARFIRAMDSLVRARGDAEILSRALDWQNVTQLLDIGSGPGSYPIYLCRQFPQLRATLFDLPGTLKITELFVREAGLDERIKLLSGDYRTDAIPGTYEVIFLSNIIHGEGYHENERLIAKLAANLKAGGQMVIKDHILDDSHAWPPVGAVFSMLMLLTTQSGRCYAFAEVQAWLEKAGLSNIQEFQLPSPLTSSLIVAQK